jgi:hypothetical protein
MRIMLVLPVLLLGACQVSKDDANNTVSVTFNQDVAANTAADIQNVASDVGNEAKETGDKISNKVDGEKTTNSSTTTTTTNTTTNRN